VPIYDLAVPAVATASNLRSLLFGAMYKVTSWPELAEHLSAMFTGNFTGVVNATVVKVDPEHAKKPDRSGYSTDVIFVRLVLLRSRNVISP
jgi:hypothetical protein